ncbi:MAG: hypothetical protein IBJ09_07410 [Bacteroidia bacterium]|nr:hypothetical protein [Bacteroidia bacterium]
MHKIYLTTGLRITESVFSGLETEYRMEARQLLEEFGDDLLKHNGSERLEFIAAGISRRNGSMLVGCALDNAAEAETLFALLHRENLHVHTLYMPSAERVNRQESRAYRELDGLGRRTDLYPQDIEANYREYRETLQGLKTFLAGTFVQLREVD